MCPLYMYVCVYEEGSNYSKCNFKRVTLNPHHSFSWNLTVRISYSLKQLDLKKMNGED